VTERKTYRVFDFASLPPECKRYYQYEPGDQDGVACMTTHAWSLATTLTARQVNWREPRFDSEAWDKSTIERRGEQ
jgi:hypothetical protein